MQQQNNGQYEFTPVLRVLSDEYTGDNSGQHWEIGYVLYRTTDYDEQICFDMYDDDGMGNGKMICRFYNEKVARQIVLRLGKFVSWN